MWLRYEDFTYYVYDVDIKHKLLEYFKLNNDVEAIEELENDVFDFEDVRDLITELFEDEARREHG